MNKQELKMAMGVYGNDRPTESALRDPISIGHDYELYLSIHSNGDRFSVKLLDANTSITVPREVRIIWGPDGASDLKAWLKNNHANNMKDGLDYWFKEIDSCVEAISQ